MSMDEYEPDEMQLKTDSCPSCGDPVEPGELRMTEEDGWHCVRCYSPPEAGLDDDDLCQIEADMEAIDAGLARTPDEAKLYRFIRYTGRLRDELARLKAESAKMIRELEAKLDFTLATQGAEMEAITRRLLKGKARHVKTPWGRAGLRSQPDTVKVIDVEALPMKFLTFKTRRLPDLKAIKQHFNDTGELPDGVEYVPQHDTFYTK